MQCKSLETKQSIRKSLVQQVEEQSDVCDVTIKMGHWEKKFHRCVLVVSPFFNQALTGNFLEKETAKIKMTIGTPVSIEMAILFLYGRKPNLTEENIHDVLMLAEFLLIPELKIVCIKWLNTVKITEENCLKLLQLASIYDFEITGCVKYIASHMKEMFHEAQMANLSKDSVQFILLERKFSYVPMDDKLRFLLKWTNSQPAKRKIYLKDLFGFIDFQEVSSELLEELKDNHDVAEAIDLEKILCNAHNETSNTCNVLIMKAENEREILWCLNLEKEKWFRVDIATYIEGAAFLFDRICGTSSMSQIFFTGRKDGCSVVSELNLETDTCISYKLVKKADGNNFERPSNVNVIGDVIIACENLSFTIDRQTRRTESNRQVSDINTVKTDISVLYVGHKIDDVVEMSPLLTFKDDQIASMCMNNMFSIAIHFRSRKVVAVYDLVDNTIETIPLETRYNDKLVQSHDGFVVYNNERCISLTRTPAESLNQKFKTKEVLFSTTGRLFPDNFIFCEDSWYHYFAMDFETFQFESASYSEVMSKGSIEEVAWKKLPLPKERSCNETIKGRLYQICIPKSKLVCDPECPHCIDIVEKRRYNRNIRVCSFEEFLNIVRNFEEPFDSVSRYSLEESNESNLDESFDSEAIYNLEESSESNLNESSDSEARYSLEESSESNLNESFDSEARYSLEESSESNLNESFDSHVSDDDIQ